MSEKYCIAIVDDDEAIRDALSDLMMVSGFACIAFDGAAAFLAGRADHDFSCLVTDMRMPGMSGIELLAHLHDSGASLPVVVLTSVLDDTTRARALALGAHAWLTKPVADDRLLAAIASAVEADAAP
ncbi:response regulator [Sphingopyxis sp. PAMC25046]|uniref:response regulator transcription factor n=1 Tax=Sphingopyxis sp. PAMC25046 TaxID=2565556 RepID=UPI001FFA07C0|nr:response regulator [Sphingopyxis sp. PAMC25046]